MYKLLNKILLIIMNIGTIIVATLEFTNNNYARAMTFVAIFPLLLIPFIINKTKFKLSDKEIFLYYLFILLADFIGCVCNLYNTVSWYDIFVHFLSGMFTFVLATAQDNTPANPTEMAVAVKDAKRDCLNAFENFLAPITAPTSTVVIVDNIRTSGRIMAKSQNIHNSIFKELDIVHFFPVTVFMPR